MSIAEDRDLTAPDNLLDMATEEEAGLPGRRCRVQLEGGDVFVVRITNREYIAWDKTAPRKKWGAMGEVPFLAATFMAWIAAKREGKTGLTWEQWQEAVVDCENLPEEPEDLARPTQRAPEPGTS